MERYLLLFINLLLLIIQITCEIIFVKHKLIDDKNFELRSKKLWYRLIFGIGHAIVLTLIIFGTTKAVMQTFLDLFDEDEIGIAKALVEILFNVNSGLDIVSVIFVLLCIALTFTWDKLLLSISKTIYFKNFKNIFKKRYFKILNANKVLSCSHLTSKENVTEQAIEEFNKFYIAKKTLVGEISINDNSVYINNLKEAKRNSILEEIKGEKEEKSFLVIGDAGSGKSTLLIKTYIDLCNIFINSKKKDNPYFPLIFDFSYDHSVSLEEAMNKSIIKILDSKIFQVLCGFCKDFNQISNKIYKKLLKYNNNFFIFDSWDEINKVEIKKNLSNILPRKGINTLLNKNTTIIIGCRENSKSDFFREIDKETLGFNKVFKVRDFSEAEAYKFIDNLKNAKIITLIDNGLEKIKEAFKLITFDNSINPFLANTVIQKFKHNIDPKYKYEIKLDNLLSRSIFDLIQINYSDFKDNIENYEFLQYVAIRGAGFDTIDSLVIDRIDENKIKKIKENTYLIDNENKFYQKIFSDYYSARFIFFKSREHLNENLQNIYNYMLKDISNNPIKFSDILHYLPVILDGDLNRLGKNIDYLFYLDKDKGKIYKVFNNLLNNLKEDENRKDKTLYIFKEILSFLNKITSESSIKDDRSVTLSALYNKDKVFTIMYTLFLSIMSKDDIYDYDDYLYLFSSNIEHHLALKSIFLVENNNKIFLMLSCLRDSYCALNFNEKVEFYKEFYQNTELINEINALNQSNNLLNLATNNKKIKEMNNRELLNYLYYGNNKIEINLDNYSINAFPNFMNVLNFIDETNYKCKEEIVFNYPKIDGTYYKINEITKFNTFLLPLQNIEKNNNYFKPIIALYYLDKNINENNLRQLLKQDEIIENIRSIDLSNNVKDIKEPLYFNGFINLRNIHLPSKLESIGEFSFYDCNYIKRIIIPDSVKKLGESFVEDCHSLKEINLPKSLEVTDDVLEIGQFAFENCASLEKIDFSTIENKNYKKINIGLFIGTGLRDVGSLNLSSSLEEIPSFMFFGSKYLEKIDLEKLNNLKKVCKFAFTNSNQVKTINLPASLKEVENLAFSNLIELKEVKINSEEIILSSYCFNLTNEYTPIESEEELKKYFLSRNITLISNGVINFDNKDFYQESISGSIINDNELVIDNILDKNIEMFDSDELKEKYGVTLVGFSYDAFSNCDFLDEVRFGKGVKELYSWLFEDCNSLYTLDLSESEIKILPKHVCENCTSLAIIKLSNCVKEIDVDSFKGCKRLEELHIPQGSNITIKNNVFDKSIEMNIDLIEGATINKIDNDINIETFEDIIVYFKIKK